MDIELCMFRCSILFIFILVEIVLLVSFYNLLNYVIIVRGDPESVSRCGTLDMNLVASRFNTKLGKLVSRYRDLLAEVDALVTPWDGYRLI